MSYGPAAPRRRKYAHPFDPGIPDPSRLLTPTFEPLGQPRTQPLDEMIDQEIYLRKEGFLGPGERPYLGFAGLLEDLAELPIEPQPQAEDRTAAVNQIAKSLPSRGGAPLSGRELRPNPGRIGFPGLKIEAVADILQQVSRTAKDIDAATANMPPEKADEVRLAWFLTNALDETSYQLTRGSNTGVEWYDEDLTTLESGLAQLIDESPETRHLAGTFGKRDADGRIDPSSPRMVLFKALMAPLSFGQTPLYNTTIAWDVFEEAARATPQGGSPFTRLPPRKAAQAVVSAEAAQKASSGRNMKPMYGPAGRRYDRGEIVTGAPLFTKEGQILGQGWTLRADAVDQAIAALNRLVQAKIAEMGGNVEAGERAAAQWLLSEKTVQELKAIKPNLNLQGVLPRPTYPGAFIFGPKGGPFFLNINRREDHLTKDLWWSRTWNRIAGQILEKGEIVGGPRDAHERALMDQAADEAAGALGLAVNEFQAALWYFEQQLWQAMGAGVESLSYVDGIEEVARRKGIRLSRPGPVITAASQRRADAVAGAIGRRASASARRAADSPAGSDERARWLRRQYKRPSRALKYADRFDPEEILSSETATLSRLAQHADPDVMEMAIEALEDGNTHALFMLHDALLDAGDEDGAKSIRSLLAFAAQYPVRTQHNDQDAAISRQSANQASQSTPVGGPSFDRAIDASIGAFMTSRPKSPWWEETDREMQQREIPSPKRLLSKRPRRARYMARPQQIPQPPWQGANYGPMGYLDEMSQDIAALGDPRATQLFMTALQSADTTPDAWFDLIDYLDAADQGGNGAAGDISAQLKVEIGNDMVSRVPAHRWGDYAVDVGRHNRNPANQGNARIARQWVQPREAVIRDAQRRRLMQRYLTSQDDTEASLGHAAFADFAEDPVAFDALADLHEERGEQERSNLIRSLRPQFSKKSTCRRGRRCYNGDMDTKRKYARETRPFPRVQGPFISAEINLFEELEKHPNPDVAEMALRAYRGRDARALWMLHDALLDADEYLKATEVAVLAEYSADRQSKEAAYDIPIEEGGRTDEEYALAQYPRTSRVMAEQMSVLPQSKGWEQRDKEMRERPLPFSKHPPGHRRAKYQSQEAAVFSSSNTEENLSFDEAFKRVQSGDQRAFKDIADQFMQQLGLKGTSYSAIGDWEDGAEQSVLTQIPDQVDMETLRYVGAWQGLTGNQRAVLVFRPEPQGLDSVYEVQVPETSATKIRAQLSQMGIPFRTIVPGKKGTKVVVYDQKRALRDNVAQFAQAHNAPVRETIGSGDYVGGGSRSAARAKYRQIIAEYEARNPGQARRALPQGQAGQPGGGGSAQAQEQSA